MGAENHRGVTETGQTECLPGAVPRVEDLCVYSEGMSSLLGMEVRVLCKSGLVGILQKTVGIQ